MRLVIQRVSRAAIRVNGAPALSMGQGLVVLLGIEQEDERADADWLIKKLMAMRIFSDDEGRMNLSLMDQEGDLMLVSQFTLHASTKKGNRPSFIKAAKPEVAIPLYEYFVATAKDMLRFRQKLVTGEFGADMQVELNNDGPVTITIDSKNRE